MALLTKCILASKSSSDGLRISVMSRHTLDDGLTPHPDITNELFDEWLQGLTPPPKLVGAYYKTGLSWEKLEKEYLTFLRKDPQARLVKELALRAMERDITIMCIEGSPKQCHRRILAEECNRAEPKLTIVVR